MRAPNNNRPSEICLCVIEHAGRECETAMRLAQFATDEPSLSKGIAAGLLKLAAYHSENAFAASTKLQVAA